MGPGSAACVVIGELVGWRALKGEWPPSRVTRLPVMEVEGRFIKETRASRSQVTSRVFMKCKLNSRFPTVGVLLSLESRTDWCPGTLDGKGYSCSQCRVC